MRRRVVPIIAVIASFAAPGMLAGCSQIWTRPRWNIADEFLRCHAQEVKTPTSDFSFNVKDDTLYVKYRNVADEDRLRACWTKRHPEIPLVTGRMPD